MTTTAELAPTPTPEDWAEEEARVRDAARRLKEADAGADLIRAERDRAMVEMKRKGARPVDLANAAGITSAAVAKWLRRPGRS